MKSRIIKKIAIIVLVLSITAALFLLPAGCGDVENKAIIILPGIMGSNIIDAETGDPLWAPLPPDIKMFDLDIKAEIGNIVNYPDVQKLLTKGGLDGWLNKMMMDARTGRPKHENAPQIIRDDGTVVYDRCAPYGTLNYYEKTFHYLDDKFGDTYDVRMFEYDWRLDNKVNAAKLDEFIKSHNYTSVTLVGHSMGGVLASTYIASLPEEERGVVDKFISLGAPFFGAHKALRVIDDPMSMAAGMEDVLGVVENMVNTINHDKNAFNDFFTKFMYFVHNLPTVYQLIPYEDMCAAYTGTYAEAHPEMKEMGIVTVDGNPIQTYEQFMAYFGGKDYINSRCLNKMIDWQREQYVKNTDGTYTHASMLVDTRYFVGTELETEICVDFDKNGKLIGSKTPKLGDGTVPEYSASCGLALTDPKVYEFKGISHGDLSYDNRCLDKVAEIILETK